MITQIVSASAAILLEPGDLGRRERLERQDKHSRDPSNDVKEAKADRGPDGGNPTRRYRLVDPARSTRLRPVDEEVNTLIGAHRAKKDLSDEVQYVTSRIRRTRSSRAPREEEGPYAAQVQGEFSAVISEQTRSARTSECYAEAPAALGHEGQGGRLPGEVRTFATESKKQEKELIDLAIKIRRPARGTPTERQDSSKHDFALKIAPPTTSIALREGSRGAVQITAARKTAGN